MTMFHILGRDMHTVCVSNSSKIKDDLPIDDSNDGQVLEILSNMVIGTYDFSVPKDHPDSKWVVEGNYIAFKDKYEKTRMYTIMEISGSDTLDVHCEDVGIDLINEYAHAFEKKTCNIFTALESVKYDTGWEIGVNEIPSITKEVEFESDSDTWLSRIGQIADIFDCEIDFSIELTMSRVTKQVINIYKKLGNESVSQIFLSDLNLISLNRNGSINELYTCVLPYGNEINEKKISISEIEYDDGIDLYSPLGDPRLYSRKGLEKWSRFKAFYNDEINTKSTVGYINYHMTEYTDSSADLLEMAITFLKEHSDVKIEWEADLYNLQADIGDTISITDTSGLENVSLSARIQSVTNHYTIDGSDTGTLANYKIVKQTTSSELEKMINEFGKDIVTIKSATVTYQIGKSGQEPPIGIWEINIPVVPEGDYLWTRTVTTYSNESETVAYSVSKDGANGDDGKTLYTWIKYADSQTGVGISDDPIGKSYIGVAYNRDDQIESINPKDYTWSLIKGEDAEPIYTWTKYADDKYGNNMSDDPTGKDYIGFAFNKHTEIESTNPDDYIWSLIKGEDGKIGSVWYTGTNITGTSEIGIVFPTSNVEYANENDLYLNTNTNNVYICILKGSPDIAKWKWSSNVKGTGGVNPWIGNQAVTIATSSERIVLANTDIEIPYSLFEGTNIVDSELLVKNQLPNGVSVKSNTLSTNSNPGKLILLVNVLSDLGGITESFDNITIDLVLNNSNTNVKYDINLSITKAIRGADASIPLTEINFTSNDTEAILLDTNTTYPIYIKTIDGVTYQNNTIKPTPENKVDISVLSGNIIVENMNDVTEKITIPIPNLFGGNTFITPNKINVATITRILSTDDNWQLISPGKYKVTIDDAYSTNTATMVYSNYFRFNPILDTNGDCYIQDGFLHLCATNYATLNDFLDFINSNVVEIVYKAKTASLELIDPILANLLNAIYPYDDSKITLDSELSTIFTGTYYTKYKGDSTAIQSVLPPANLTELWCDISISPPQLKRWSYDQNAWIKVNDWTDDIEKIKEEITTDYDVKINKLESSLETSVTELTTTIEGTTELIKAINTSVEQTAAGITIVTSELKTVIDDMTGLATKEEIAKWARFIDGVLSLGETNSPFEVRLSNTELGFYQSGSRIAYISNQKLHISQAVILDQINLGDFVLQVDVGEGFMLR